MSNGERTLFDAGAASPPAGAVAVVGLACRVPGAETPDELWRNLAAGVESITSFSDEELVAAGVDPAELRRPGYVRAKGVLAGADTFDAGFFGYSPREAALMDPQLRVFLECAWAALEDAGYDSRQGAGTVGVFAGSILSVYLVRHLWPNRALVEAAGTFQTAVGNDPTFLATSASYHLDLRGPSVTVGTACSTSLTAVHLACSSLLAYECDLALAGGVSVHLPLVTGYRYEGGGILSPDGHCRPFDAAAAGTVSSDGVGVVTLKRLADAVADGDFIHAVIRGSALTNDGSGKVGYTAPSVDGEARAIREALAVAEVAPETVAMVETHGAGTLLGDPIEVAALRQAFGERAGGRPTCALGSIKSNVGHLDAAAGIGGLIKAVLAVRHGQIPPTLHFQSPNPRLELEKTPFYVNDTLVPMPALGGAPRRAGVSSFGIGGTNVHVVLEEAPPRPPAADPAPPRCCDLLLLSARTAEALDAATDRLATRLEQALADGEELALADVADTLRRGRRAFAHRRALVAADLGEAARRLRERSPNTVANGVAPATRPSVAFLFPGLGDHYPEMGWELYCTEEVFRTTVDECAELLRGHLDGDLRDVLYPGRDRARRDPGTAVAPAAAPAAASGLDLRAVLMARKERAKQGSGAGDPAESPAASAPLGESDRPSVAQPAIFVTEVALAALLRSWGVEPEAVIGHSIGEFAAAWASGVLSLADALKLVAARARLIESRALAGAMLAVPLTEEELRPLLPASVRIGAVNRVKLCIAAGEEEGVAALEAALDARQVSCQRLRSTHAFHSQMMEPLVEPLLALLRDVELHAPAIPLVSGITGRFLSDAEATDPAYWAHHLCNTVRFRDGLALLLEDPHRILLEVGPGQSLTSHAINERSRPPARENPVIPTMRWAYAPQPELAALLRGVGQLWCAGGPLDAERFLDRPGRRRVPLPTYPFERRRYWIDPPADGASASAPAIGKRPDVADWFYLPAWKPSLLPRPQPDAAGAGWLLFADAHGVAAGLAVELRGAGESVVVVTPGAGFDRRGDAVVLDPACDADYDALARSLAAEARPGWRVVHLWALTGEAPAAPSHDRFAALQTVGYESVLRLLRALLRAGVEPAAAGGGVRLEIVADRVCDALGGEELVPEKATLRAPALVAPQEHPGLICRVIDSDLAASDPERRAALVAQLLAELRGGGREPLVAYRRGRRLVPGYEAVRLAAPAPSPFRRRGVYLLTGGLGGVGLVLARHLAESVAARLVLVGRSAFPERAEWDGWLAAHGEEDPTSVKIRRLEELESLGAEVLVLAADVADRAAMAAVFAAVDERFGELHGVVHGAGAVGVETFREIRQLTAVEWRRQFVAKVHGVLVLDELLAGRRLDFCLLLSSLSAVLGGLGFAAYSAANLFLDAFAAWRAGVDAAAPASSPATPWVSVDWDSWRLADVAPAVAGLGATVSDFVMEPDEGAAACERILAQPGVSQVVVSTGDLDARLRQWTVQGEAARPSAPAVLHERPNLSAAYAPPRGELERRLAEIWQELFGVEQVGIDDNFFELGGHSLLATQLNARLQSQLRVELSLAALLRAPTVAELAAVVVEQQAADADPAALEQILAEVGELSSEEIERLLAEDADGGGASEAAAVRGSGGER